MLYFELFCVTFMIVQVAASKIKGLNEKRRSSLETVGSLIDIDQAPYVASLFWSNDTRQCGAAIVRPSFVVSAGHCIKNNERYYVKVGTNSLAGGMKYEIARTFIHPNYEKDDFIIYNDVSVIEIDGEMSYSERVTPIILAPKDLKLEPDLLLEMLIFGPDNERKYYLQRQFVTYMDIEKCNKIMKTEVNLTVMCAVSSECVGDSGGPVVYNDMLVGIVSRCEENLPSLFARVSYNIDFIENTISNNS